MFSFIDPDTGYVCTCTQKSSVPAGLSFKPIIPHKVGNLDEAIADYDDDGNPVFDIKKAKEVVHAKRRLLRDDKFEPLDKIVMIHSFADKEKAEEAEKGRVQVRKDNDKVKKCINRCKTINALQKIIGEEL